MPAGVLVATPLLLLVSSVRVTMEAAVPLPSAPPSQSGVTVNLTLRLLAPNRYGHYFNSFLLTFYN